jgi:hypothetical protein
MDKSPFFGSACPIFGQCPTPVPGRRLWKNERCSGLNPERIRSGICLPRLKISFSNNPLKAGIYLFPEKREFEKKLVMVVYFLEIYFWII